MNAKFKKYEPLIKAAAHLLAQIENATLLEKVHKDHLEYMIEHNNSGHVFPFTDNEIKAQRSSLSDYSRQVIKYDESLDKVINEISKL
jgi:hypothetical protein